MRLRALAMRGAPLRSYVQHVYTAMPGSEELDLELEVELRAESMTLQVRAVAGSLVVRRAAVSAVVQAWTQAWALHAPRAELAPRAYGFSM